MGRLAGGGARGATRPTSNSLFTMLKGCWNCEFLTGISVYEKNNFGLASPIFASRNFIPTFRQPKPYLQLRWKLMDDASLKYFVGQLTSPMVKPCHKICASIWLSKTKSSEFCAKFGSSFFSRALEKAE